jgi:hypothetical protein
VQCDGLVEGYEVGVEVVSVVVNIGGLMEEPLAGGEDVLILCLGVEGLAGVGPQTLALIRTEFIIQTDKLIADDPTDGEGPVAPVALFLKPHEPACSTQTGFILTVSNIVVRRPRRACQWFLRGDFAYHLSRQSELHKWWWRWTCSNDEPQTKQVGVSFLAVARSG